MRLFRMEHARDFCFILIAVLILSVARVSFVSAATTTIHVDPPASNVASGDTFNINITITDVNNLTGWEFKLFYLNALLNCSAVTEGPFLKTWGNTFHVFNITNNYNSTHGRVLAGCSLTGMTVSVNGSGVLATVAFMALFGGDTPLTLSDTKLSDEKFPSQPIAHADISGTVHVTGPAANYDIAVTNVTFLKRAVGKGYSNNVTVTLQNQGDLGATFNVTISANAAVIGTSQVTLANGNTTSIIFPWNTTGFAYGNYTLSAYATPLPGETDISDNTLVDGVVTITVPGDINGDGTVDIYDAIILAGAFNSHVGSSNWNPNADINCDNFVDIYDAIILASHFNQKIP